MMDSINTLQKNKYFVGILFAVILFIECGWSETIYEQCNEENNTTLVCNYIPWTLSRQYDNVRILDFKRTIKSEIINSSNFIDKSWENVKSIEFFDSTGRDFYLFLSRECFQGLKSLKELKIHVSSFEFAPDAFVGLPSVHTLDVSKCYRLLIKDICYALKANNALPRLRNLVMSGIGSFVTGSNNITQKEVEYLLPRNITKIDISRTQINFVNITAISKNLKSIQNINVSHSVIEDFWTEGIEDMKNLKVIDASYSVLPTRVFALFPGRYIFVNRTGRYSDFISTNDFKNTLTALTINVSGIIPNAVSVLVYNCKMILDEPLDWTVKQVIARKNNLKYLDVEFVCRVHKFTSIRHFDLAENNMEMINPLTCLPNVEIIDLSKNKMFKMLGNSPDLFEKLFASNRKLREISLSDNQLPNLPKYMFQQNKNIEVIDLSYNNLTQLHLDLMDLHRLRLLNLRYNKIAILDEVSIRSLNGISSAEDGCLVEMTSNPFLCSTCSCKSSIRWLLSSTLVDVKQQDILCFTEDATNVHVDESVAKRVQAICDRNVIIIVSTSCSTFLLVTVCIIGVVLYKRKRRLRRKRNMETVISRFITGEDQYEFVVFLSYSGRDEEFVKDYVIDPLNENLNLMIGTDRNLICTGDQHLRPGFTVNDEINLCLDRVSVVIVVVSDNFCRSLYCRNEFDQAYLQRKPIVLMMLGNVNEELMMPTLKRLYKRDVRVLWKTENGQFVLTTSWENICSSILEKVQV